MNRVTVGKKFRFLIIVFIFFPALIWADVYTQIDRIERSIRQFKEYSVDYEPADWETCTFKYFMFERKLQLIVVRCKKKYEQVFHLFYVGDQHQLLKYRRVLKLPSLTGEVSRTYSDYLVLEGDRILEAHRSKKFDIRLKWALDTYEEYLGIALMHFKDKDLSGIRRPDP